VFFVFFVVSHGTKENIAELFEGPVMRRAGHALIAILFVTGSWTRADDATRQADVIALQKAMQKAIERAEPSIACIMVTRGNTKGEFTPEKANFIPQLYGSGVVIDAQGLVLTNEHVVHGATGIYVKLPGDKSSYAAIRASDQRSDLAVLKLDSPPAGLKAIPLGQGEKVRKGQFILSLANPFAAGFRDGSPSASWGIVSNLRRRAPLSEGEIKEDLQAEKTLSQFAVLIQTDARINLGCSGGAIIDLDGKLVGLTSALAALNGSETPGGFAMPIDSAVRGMIEKLRRGEEVEYGFLGVIFGGPFRGQGVLIERLVSGGPAENAGMQFIRNDCLILSIDGTAVHNQQDLAYQISTKPPGTPVKIEWRPANGGVSTSTRVVLGKMYMPSDRFTATKRPRWVGGIRVDYSSTLARLFTNRWRDTSIPRGVAVREVEPKSAADNAGLTADSIITRVNGQSVETPADFYRAVQAARGPLELTIYGRGKPIQLDPR
jgi:S1-C subfamily serine protease